MIEGDLRMTLPLGIMGRKFDDAGHGLSHCMKAVDWILDLPEEIWFVELKDPDAARAVVHGHSKQFISEFLAGNRTPHFVNKFRDSFLYEWACNRVDKPIRYYVIVALSTLDAAQLLARTEDLRRRLPTGPQAMWRRAIAGDCLVFNMDKWNEKFPDFPLARAGQRE